MTDETKCFINSEKGCVIHDEAAIVLAVGSVITIAIFIAGTSIFTDLVTKLTKGE